MKCNVGGMERTARIVLGIVLLIVAVAAPLEATLRLILLVIAAIALLTGAVRFCPINAMLGLNSCEGAHKK